MCSTRTITVPPRLDAGVCTSIKLLVTICPIRARRVPNKHPVSPCSKPVPITCTNVPPASGPELGYVRSISATGTYRNPISAASAAGSKLECVTASCTTCASLTAGHTQLTAVSFTPLASTALPPNQHRMPPDTPSPLPTTVTLVPPRTGPMLGTARMPCTMLLYKNTVRRSPSKSCPLLLTYTLRLPATADIGAVHRTIDSDTNRAPACSVPMRHSRIGLSRNPLPVTVTCVPPDRLPDEGRTDSTRIAP